MSNPGYISRPFAERTAAVVRWAERVMRSGSSLPPPREHKGQGYYEIGVARLTENLAAGDHATATIQRQNPSTAAFSDSEADDAEVEIYDSLEFLSSTDSEILASGCIVIFWRNPATGFRNLIGSPCCPSTEA